MYIPGNYVESLAIIWSEWLAGKYRTAAVTADGDVYMWEGLSKQHPHRKKAAKDALLPPRPDKATSRKLSLSNIIAPERHVHPTYQSSAHLSLTDTPNICQFSVNLAMPSSSITKTAELGCLQHCLCSLPCRLLTPFCICTHKTSNVQSKNQGLIAA